MNKSLADLSKTIRRKWDIDNFPDLYVEITDQLKQKIRNELKKNNISLDFKIGTLNSWLRTGKTKRRIKYKNLKLICSKLGIKDFKEEIISIGMKSGKRIPNPFPLNLDENVAYVVGHLYGDGGIGLGKSDRYRVHYTNKNKYLLGLFIRKIKKAFPIEDVWKSKPNIVSKAITIVIPSVIGYILFKMGVIAFGERKEIPLFIKKSNKKIKGAFLRALFDDDGTLSLPAKEISLISSGNFIFDIQNLLKSIGIRSKIVKINYSQGAQIFKLYINSRLMFIKFKKFVGFLHPIKKRKLKKLINSYQVNAFPKNYTRKKIIKILKTGPKTKIEIEKTLKRGSDVIYSMVKEKIIERKLIYRSGSVKRYIYFLKKNHHFSDVQINNEKIVAKMQHGRDYQTS